MPWGRFSEEFPPPAGYGSWAEAAAVAGLRVDTVMKRKRRGWSDEDALTTPAQARTNGRRRRVYGTQADGALVSSAEAAAGRPSWAIAAAIREGR